MATISNVDEPVSIATVTPVDSGRRTLLVGEAAPPTPTPVPPVVTIISPPVGTGITKTDPLVIEVTDEAGSFTRILFMADFPTLGVREVVHDGETFSQVYATGSAREAIVNGFRYTLLRNGGWPASPTIVPIVIDSTGEEAA